MLIVNFYIIINATDICIGSYGQLNISLYLAGLLFPNYDHTLLSPAPCFLFLAKLSSQFVHSSYTSLIRDWVPTLSPSSSLRAWGWLFQGHHPFILVNALKRQTAFKTFRACHQIVHSNGASSLVTSPAQAES